jgi:hypothetical protein
VHQPARLSAYSTPQPPISQPIDADHHLLFAGFDFGHTVGFQAQLFSDKGCNEHLGPFPFFGCLVTTMKGYSARGAFLVSALNSKDSKDFNSDYTFRTGTGFQRTCLLRIKWLKP